MADQDGSDANGTIAYWPFDEGEGPSAEEAVTGRRDSVDHALADARFKPNEDPRWVDGVAGSGLLFDGYSTRIEHDRRLFDGDADELAVEAWVAPRAFEGGTSERLSAIVSHRSVEDDRGFELGLDGHGRCSFQVGLGDSWEAVRTDDPLPTYAWSHVVGVFDGDGALRIHVDGKRAATARIPRGGAIVPADVPVRIGKNNRTERTSGPFTGNAFAGAIDELRIRDCALDADDIGDRYESACDGEHPSLERETIALDPSRYRGDPHRPQYHPIPPGHWMNEPHGPLYHDGRYHLFYQHNPSGPYWGNIHWGHWVSDDLVHWRHVEPALAPAPDGIAPDGIWSGGSTHDADGEPVLLFTAGDMSRTPDQRVATAHPVDSDDPDLTSWRRSDDVAIERPHSIGLRDNDFRDPFVWRDGDTWYCLVGAGFEDGGGTALVYESESLEEWQFRGSLFRSDHDEYPELGLVWELPVLLPVGEDETGAEKHVFVVSPVEGAAEVEVYYWLGEWDPDDCRFEPDHDEPRLIDYGDFHFTGPHGMVDPETGRSLLFTIAQDDRRPRDHYDAGWAHNGGLPVHLYLRDDGRLGVEPIEELRSLRSERLADVREAQIPEANDELTGVRSSTAEIRATMVSDGAEKYGLKVRANPDGTEETLLYYDERTERIVVHRERSTRDPETRAAISERSSLVHRGEVDLAGEDLDLHVYLDGSMLEVYVNGLKGVTTRLYPEDERSTRIEAWADGDAIVERLDVWNLDEASS